MKIKPLEWVENNWSGTAETPFGYYRIIEQGYGYSCSFQFNGRAHETILNKLNATNKEAYTLIDDVQSIFRDALAAMTAERDALADEMRKSPWPSGVAKRTGMTQTGKIINRLEKNNVE